MNKLLSDEATKEIVYVNDSRELKGVKGLANKRLCIIKTNFKDIKKIKNVIQYPVKEEVINDLLNNTDLTRIKEKSYLNNKYNFDDLKDLKVMIVDDNPFNTELLEETLKPFNFNLSIFQKSKEALKLIDNEKFDLFLLDIMMPELSGYELAEKIKKTQLNSTTPIVFVSALSDNENKLKSFELGSYIYIEKPFNINIIKTQISSLLREQKEKEKIAHLQESYLAMITHDMKGPVQAEISALNYLLNKENFDEEQREILYDMLSSSKYLQNLVSNVLQKFKADNGSLVITKKSNSLKKLITECCDEIKYLASERNLSLKVSYKTEYENILFDYEELKRVIHNLLINALKYSYKNSNIYITAEDDGENIIVSVKNSGDGISKEYQDNIFDKFITFCETQKSASCGLGLHIAKEIVKLHGGTIKFKSIPKEFTTLTFTLPLE